MSDCLFHRLMRTIGTPLVNRWILAWFVCSSVAVTMADEPTVSSVLHLADGGFVPGSLKESADAGIIRWQSPAFSTPFDFRLNKVNTVQFPPPKVNPKPVGDYCFELTGGDVLFGSILNMNEKTAELNVARLGHLHIARSQIQRMVRWQDGDDLIYLGPNGFADWQERSTSPGWREESGQMVSDEAGAMLRGDFELPVRGIIELEISWKKQPDFVMAIGVNANVPWGSDPNLKLGEGSFRLEAWESDLVVQRETETEADLAIVQHLSAGPGRTHLAIYFDQENGRIQVFSPAGKSLADLKVKGKIPKTNSAIFMQNKKGDIRLERLRITRWNGEAPNPSEQDKTQIRRIDGTIAVGPITKYDASAKQFVIKESKDETRIAADKVSGVSFPVIADDRPRSIRVILQDGARLSGNLVKVEKGELWLTLPGMEESPHIPFVDLRSLVALHNDSAEPTKADGIGRLEMDKLRLRGQLAENVDKSSGSRLAWQPIGSANASPFRQGLVAKIIYRDPAPPKPPVQVQVMQQPQRPVGFLQGAFRLLAGNSPAPSAPEAPVRRAIYLRTGDIVPAELSMIDEDGVTFRTPLTDGSFVPHNRMKAVELAPDSATPLRINKAKRERLLTLPRMQKDSPPTQLIRSKNGDYLRGRVLKMDNKTLQVEIRLETKDVPRERISRIIWLHADELDKPKDTAKKLATDGTTLVQAVRSDGFRLTFVADRLTDRVLSGKSEVLGTCRVKLDEIDQLLFNGAIEQAATQLEYQQWKLRNAEEPKFAKDEGDASPNGGNSGTESPLVGKPAPDFTLDLVGGKPFHLADSKGQVVVLDFWATWCGPCLQAMPQVDRVTREFEGRGVKLIAVNLQESPKEITAMLERHKLNLTVALDRDGGVAEKYAATAIPQTVIINRDGTVARLFVGGGNHFEDQFREALKAVISPDDKAMKPK